AFRDRGPFKSITATPGHLRIRFGRAGAYGLLCPDAHNPLPEKRISDYIENDEPLLLTPDARLKVAEFHASYSFTPVIFKNQQKGFQIANVSNGISFGRGITTNSIAYIALGDVPAEMGEGDVAEEIKLPPPPKPPEDPQAAWLYKRAEELGFPIPEPSPATTKEAAPPTEPQTAAAEDAQPEAQAEARTLWPYALIPPAFLAALWVARKRRRDSKNCKL
ncbi:MAG: hypothetical protein FWG50_09835, partial [Kiritimatiellaeota bacterium]|nr:hypothetical protein [Kiritimatiellota bacterium]